MKLYFENMVTTVNTLMIVSLGDEIIENKIEVYMPYFLHSYINICAGTEV